MLSGAEVTATGRGEEQAGDGPVDTRTRHSDTRTWHSDTRSEKRALARRDRALPQPVSPRAKGLPKDSTKDHMKSSPEERERRTTQWKEELPLEEAELVLLEKLRQSQVQKVTTAQKPAGSAGRTVTTPSPLVRGTRNSPSGKPSLQTSSAGMPGSVIPPPLAPGGQQVSSKLSRRRTHRS